jgi:hypothetical protein
MPEKNRTVPPIKRAAKKGGMVAISFHNNLTSALDYAKGNLPPIRQGSLI